MIDLPWYAYLIVVSVAGLVGCGELVARYRDAPLDVLWHAPGWFYVAVNALAGLVALMTIDAFDWTFGAQTEASKRIIQVSTAGISAMAVLRSAVFTIRISGNDVPAGPSALMKIILDAADRAVDRGRAQRRSQAVQGIMQDVRFDKAIKKLPSDCFALMQNVSAEEQKAVLKEITSLENDDSLGNMPRSRQLGLVLMNVVGEDVLRQSVKALKAQITDQ